MKMGRCDDKALKLIEVFVRICDDIKKDFHMHFLFALLYIFLIFIAAMFDYKYKLSLCEN